MPGLLTRYVAVELLKMILVTTGVLVTVIAFGATVKPLARNLLGGFDIVRYVGFACIPMLQYALPFASGFGATLVMHRIASDNEIIAMSASGLSYRRVLRPVMIIATALFLVMVLLVNYVVPIFFTRMESMLAHDVTRLLATSVDRGEAFDLGDTRIYADQVQIEEDPEGDGVERRLVLSGVAAVQSTRRGLPETEFTAEYATLDLYKVEGRSILKLVLGDATVFRSDEETLVRMPAAEPRAIDLGRRFEPSPRMMTLQRLLEVRSNPIDYWKVRTPVDALRIERAKEDLRMEIRRRIASRGTLDLEDRGRDRSWSLGITREPGSDAGRVSTVRFRDRQRVLESGVRSFTWSVTERDGIPVVDVVMDQQDSDDPDAERIPRSAQSLFLQGHEFDPDIEADTILDWASSGEETISNPDVAARVRRLLDRYVDESNHLRWNIDARIQQRTAQSMTGPLLLILGAILAILLRQSTPLMVYLAAFIPAIADILLISGGEQTLLQGPSVTGYLLIWSGNLLLLVLCLVAWRRLVRN